MATVREAQRLGFVTDATDPRRRIVACPGAPACASGLIAARSLAAEIARDVPLAGEGLAVHVSGCAKGCAHPTPAPLTIVGTEQGCGLIANDTARATPSTYLDPSELVAGARRHAEQDARGRQCLSTSIISATAPPSMSAPSPSSAPRPICRASRAEEAEIAVRMIHACGQVTAAERIEFAPGLVAAARGALIRGAPILCDAEMVAHGVTRARLPAKNAVICTLRDPARARACRQARHHAVGRRARTVARPARRARWSPSATRRPRCSACWRCWKRARPGLPPFSAFPVGFVGAAESKEALAANSFGVPYLIVRGRMGGSAMTAAAVNALAREGL